MIDYKDHKQKLELFRDTFRARIADGSATQRDRDELDLVERELADLRSSKRKEG